MTTRSIVLQDNLDYLKIMPAGSVDLIYIGPPFNTGKRQERRRIKVVRDERNGDRNGFQGKRYRTLDLGTSGWDDVFDDFLGLGLRAALEEEVVGKARQHPVVHPAPVGLHVQLRRDGPHAAHGAGTRREGEDRLRDPEAARRAGPDREGPLESRRTAGCCRRR